MRIGISVIAREGQSVWDGSHLQRVAFLALSLRALPFVDELVLLECGDGSALPPDFAQTLDGLRRLNPVDAEGLDLVIDLAGRLDVTWLDRMRARGTRVVLFASGQSFAGLAEPHLFDATGPVMRPDRCDEVWLLPRDEAHAPVMRTLHRCPVRIAPFLWAPHFVARRAAALAAQGIVADWQPPAAGAGWRVGIFEPNRSVTRTFPLPMLACDLAYRQAPGAIGHMAVYNSMHMARHRTLLHLAGSLDLVREHRATFLDRSDLVSALAAQVDVVVSHQWGHAQSHLHLDALYLGYPLVHNSPWLGAAGYAYPGFEAGVAASQLLQATTHHAQALPGYREQARRLFDAVSPTHPANLQAHAQLVLALWGHRLPARRAA